jgi:hypothetical protein
MREWALRAVVMISDYLDQAGRNAAIPIDTIVLHPLGAPEPDMLAVIAANDRVQDALGGWSADEHPPDPITETKGAFLRRMDRAYALRESWLGSSGPSRRALSQHAEWFARWQVGRETVGEILHRYPDSDPSNVLKARESFSDLIELPARKQA